MFKKASVAIVCMLLSASSASVFGQAKSEIQVFNKDETIDGEQHVCFSVKNLGPNPGNGV